MAYYYFFRKVRLYFSMTYYVYENWQVRPKKAKVHFGDCYCCNYGRGQFSGTDPSRGNWSESFNTFNEAWGFAVRSEYPESTCGHCDPK